MATWVVQHWTYDLRSLIITGTAMCPTPMTQCKTVADMKYIDISFIKCEIIMFNISVV